MVSRSLHRLPVSASILPIPTLTAIGCSEWNDIHSASRWYIGIKTPPFSRQASGTLGVILDLADRELAQPGRKRIGVAVVWNPQGPLESDLQRSDKESVVNCTNC